MPCDSARLIGARLLAMILFEKFGQYQPLNRQRDRYEREGVPLSPSTLADQVGACAAALRPLYLLIEAHVLTSERLHGEQRAGLSTTLSPGPSTICSRPGTASPVSSTAVVASA